MARLLVNVAGLKIGWLACVLGGAQGLPALGPVVVAGIVAIHLFLAEKPGIELRLIAIVALIGLAWDSALVATGFMSYPSGTVVTGLAPYWIVAMWVLFATALNVGLSWLKGNLLLASLFGGVGGALAFFGGYRLGGVYMPDLAAGLAAQAVGWAIIMPLLTVIASRLDGAGRSRAPAMGRA